ERHDDLDLLGRPGLRHSRRCHGERKQKHESNALEHGRVLLSAGNVASEIDAVAVQGLLQSVDRNIRIAGISRKRKMRRRSGGLSHDEAWTADPRPDWPSCVIEAQRPATSRLSSS